MKKNLKIMLMSMLLVSSLTACGSASSNKNVTAIQPVNINFDVDSIDNGTISFEYPKSKWEKAQKSFPGIAVILISNDSQENDTNVNVTISEDVKMPLDKFLKSIPDTYKEIGSNIIVDSTEIKTLDDKEVAYNENTVKFTEENIKKCLEKGTLTEEMIKASGGKEALLNIPPKKQIQMTFYLDNKSTTVTGTYSEESERENILECMTTIVQTAKLK